MGSKPDARNMLFLLPCPLFFIMKDPFKKLLQNVKLSARYGHKGARETVWKNRYKQKKPSKHIWFHKLNITAEDLKLQWKRQRGKCWWLGIPMSLEDLFVPNSPFGVSVDRVDSSGGYTPDNIVLTMRFSNLGRGAYDDPGVKRRMRKLIREVY